MNTNPLYYTLTQIPKIKLSEGCLKLIKAHGGLKAVVEDLPDDHSIGKFSCYYYLKHLYDKGYTLFYKTDTESYNHPYLGNITFSSGLIDSNNNKFSCVQLFWRNDTTSNWISFYDINHNYNNRGAQVIITEDSTIIIRIKNYDRWSAPYQFTLMKPDKNINLID